MAVSLFRFVGRSDSRWQIWGSLMMSEVLTDKADKEEVRPDLVNLHRIREVLTFCPGKGSSSVGIFLTGKDVRASFKGSLTLYQIDVVELA